MPFVTINILNGKSKEYSEMNDDVLIFSSNKSVKLVNENILNNN